MKSRYLFLLLFVGLMMTLSAWTHDREWIFPEATALCLGLWVIDKVVWRVTRPRLFLMLVGMGTTMQLLSPLSFTVNVCLVFIAAAILLYVMRCTAYPVISAGILPLVTGQCSWRYPLVVAMLAGLLCLGQWLMEVAGFREKHEFLPSMETPQGALRRWLPLLLIVMAVAFVAERSGYRFIVVPPLIVTLVEFTAVDSGIRKQPMVVILLILLGALLGTGAQLTAVHTAIPAIWCYLATLFLLFGFFEIIGRRFAPAVAMVLIPAIIPAKNLLLFPVHATVGASLFILLATVFYRKKPLASAFKSLCNFNRKRRQ